ncbi:cupin, partial [Candidatus Sumerlaeota bacterium]|nr:cupin [Candidatus Sumerlaeota bacterium]
IVGAGVLIHIPPDCYHSTVNVGSEPMRLLAIYAPPGPEAQLRQMEGVTIEPPRKP